MESVKTGCVKEMKLMGLCPMMGYGIGLATKKKKQYQLYAAT
jgi:hypothetical protein